MTHTANMRINVHFVYFSASSLPDYSKMPLAPGSSADSAKMQTKLSAWTPLNNSLANSKVR